MRNRIREKKQELAQLFAKAEPFLSKGTYRVSPTERFFWRNGSKNEVSCYRDPVGFDVSLVKKVVYPTFTFKTPGRKGSYGNCVLVSPLGKITVIGKKSNPVVYVFPDYETTETIGRFFNNISLMEGYLPLPSIIWKDDKNRAFATEFVKGKADHTSIPELLSLIAEAEEKMISSRPESTTRLTPKNGSFASLLSLSSIPGYVQHGDIHMKNFLRDENKKLTFIDLELVDSYYAGFDMLLLLIEGLLEGKADGEKIVRDYLKGEFDSLFKKVFSALKEPFGKKDRDKYLALTICETFDRYEGKVAISKTMAKKKMTKILAALPLTDLPYCQKLYQSLTE